MNMLPCLENIVGVSKLDCDCITDGLTQNEKDALKVSVSGLYIEDLPGGIELKTTKTLDSCRNLAEIMLGARDRAIGTLQDDLIVAIGNRYEKAAKPYKGTIGRPSYAITLSDTRQFQGMRLRPRNHTDATVTVKRVSLIGNATVDIPFYIVRTLECDNGKNGVVVYTDVIAASANNFVAVTLPAGGLVLPLMENGYVFEYWVYFDKGGTSFLPKDSKLGCNCSSSTKSLLDDYFHVQGVGFADPANMTSTGTFDGYTHGFILDVEIVCESKALICREYSDNEKVSVAMAWAANFKAGEYVIEEVMKSSEVNRYTLQAKEYNWGKRNHYRAEYDQRVKYIAGAVDPNSSDCFMCKERELFFAKINS